MHATAALQSPWVLAYVYTRLPKPTHTILFFAAAEDKWRGGGQMGTGEGLCGRMLFIVPIICYILPYVLILRAAAINSASIGSLSATTTTTTTTTTTKIYYRITNLPAQFASNDSFLQTPLPEECNDVVNIAHVRINCPYHVAAWEEGNTAPL